MRTLAILAALMFGGSILATPASAAPAGAKTQLVGKKHNKKAKKHVAKKHVAKKHAAKKHAAKKHAAKGAHKKHHKAA
jgi:hypothetical protein